jgi:hypothetical protein
MLFFPGTDKSGRPLVKHLPRQVAGGIGSTLPCDVAPKLIKQVACHAGAAVRDRWQIDFALRSAINRINEITLINTNLKFDSSEQESTYFIAYIARIPLH